MCRILMKDVSFGYEHGMVLEHVDLEIEPGDFAGIIGSNGTGKSTLVKLMLGLLMPKDGCIQADYASVGYVPQVGLAVKADFPATVMEVVLLNMYRQTGLFKRPGKKHREAAEKALDIVGMLDKKDRLIGRLSGGQQQRVMIARALVSEPDILLLDEPAAGVDSEHEQKLYELLERLNTKQKLTIVMVTHTIEQVEESMNKIYRIKDKKVTRRK